MRRVRRSRFVARLLLWALFCVGASNWPERAYAQAPDAATPSGTNPAAANEARERVELGVLYYDTNRFADAVREFERAYELSQRPGLLFNIARAKSKLGLEVEAIAYLKRYVEARPDAPDTSSVRAEIEARERALVESEAKRKAEAETAAMRRTALEAEQRAAAARAEEATTQWRAREKQRLFRRNLGIDLLIVGGLVAIAGGGFGGAAISEANTVSNARGEFDGPGCCAAVERRGQTFASIGIAFDVIGIATAISGATLLGLHVKAEPAPSAGAR